jgi:hypothetical protein
MSGYVGFLDIVGIKDLAKYSFEAYHRSMETFRNNLFRSSSIFDQRIDNNSCPQIHFFSDCAFIESTELETLLDFIVSLRKSLNRDENLFFTAAIAVGELQAFSYYGQRLDDQSLVNVRTTTKDLLDGHQEYVRGTIFQSTSVSQVYVLQNNFKGVGVYIENEVLEKWKESKRQFITEEYESKNRKRKQNRSKQTKAEEVKSLLEIAFNEFKEKYISNSFYFPNIVSNKVFSYLDLRLSDPELDDVFFDNILKRYYSSNVKNKKYGRFYLTHFANWISSSEFPNLETEKGSTEETEYPKIYTKLIEEHNVLIDNLKSTAHCFEFLYFFLLNKAYETYKENNDVISSIIEKIVRIPKCKKYLTKIDEIPDFVLNMSNKERFINDYHGLLIKRNIQTYKNEDSY